MDFNLTCKSKNSGEFTVWGLGNIDPHLSYHLDRSPPYIQTRYLNQRSNRTMFFGSDRHPDVPMEQFLKDGIGEHLDFEMLY